MLLADRARDYLRPPMETARVRVRGVALAVNQAGDGGRPVLFVHGFTGAKEEFTGLLDAMAGDGWHAAALDLRGHGASDHPAGSESYDVASFAADVLAVADALEWPRFTLVGHSMGGAVAQRIAIEHPDRIDALVLMSTFHGPLAVDPGLIALGVAIVDQGGMPALAHALAARREADPAAAAARQRMEEARPGYAAWAHDKLVACSAEMWKTMVHRFPEWADTLPAMAAVQLPILVVVGSEDETMRAQCEELAAAIPGARLKVLGGVRHSPHMEAPERCLAVLREFLHRPQ